MLTYNIIIVCAMCVSDHRATVSDDDNDNEYYYYYYYVV